MQGKNIIRTIYLANFLSYGSDGQKLDLQPLNVLIGSNASGKSNLIEAFRILHAAPDQITKPISEGGGVGEFLWKGGKKTPTATISVIVAGEPGQPPLQYELSFTEFRAGSIPQFLINGEDIGFVRTKNKKAEPPFIFHLKEEGRYQLYQRQKINKEVPFIGEPEYSYSLTESSIGERHRSILSLYKSPDAFPSFTHLESIFSGIRFYTGWDLGRYGNVRLAQKADLPAKALLEDGSNLGLVLINQPPSLRQQIIEHVKKVYDGIENIQPLLEGGTVPVVIHEKGLRQPISALRLSEGTLRYICLLAVLLDPSPPPVICLEEPEVGLHPHVIPQIAELLIDASQRTQLIVTTHSDALISGLSEHPEAVIVCERDEEGTHLKRLEPAQIKPWLDRYALGDLWREGHLGGTAW